MLRPYGVGAVLGWGGGGVVKRCGEVVVGGWVCLE